MKKPKPIIPVPANLEQRFRDLESRENKLKELKENININYSDKTEFYNLLFGPDTYAEILSQIEVNDLLPPTMAQNALLVHAAFYYNNKYKGKFLDKVEDAIKDSWFWCYTGTLYVPGKGAFVQDHPQIKDEMPYMDQSELESKLQSNDKSVRFVPFGYKTGEMTSLELAKNPYVIALAGQEGAEKLAEVGSSLKYYPELFSFKSVDKPITRVSALFTDKTFESGLVVYGDCKADINKGCAFALKR